MQIPIKTIIEKISDKSGLSSQEINERIAEKMEELAGLISEEGAAHIIANELHVSLEENTPKELKISEIKPFMKNISLLGKIAQMYDLVSFDKNGAKGKVRSLILGDETGKCKASFWHGAADKLDSCKEGDILSLTKVISKDNGGRVDLSVSFEDQIEINPKDVSITIKDVSVITYENKKIAEAEQDTFVKIKGVIVQSFNPNFFPGCPECGRRVTEKEGKFFCEIHGEVEKVDRAVLNTVIDDGSGNIRSVFFSEVANELCGEELSPSKEFTKDALIGKLLTVSGKIRFNSYSQKNELVVSSIEFS